MSSRVVLCLIDAENDFQVELRKESELAALLAGFQLETYFTGQDFGAQLMRIQDCMAATPAPLAILVMAMQDQGLRRTAQNVVRAGTSFVFLNRTKDDLESIRQAAKGDAVVLQVCPDEVETGRIQGRQYLALLPNGGKLLYARGSGRSLAAADRTAGMMEVTAGSGLDITQIEAGWTRASAREALSRRLTLTARFQDRPTLIGCQTDHIARGALDALANLANELDQPALRSIPVTGCDATAKMGRVMVDSGELIASVELPRAGKHAIELLARHIVGKPTTQFTYLHGVSYPAESQLSALA